MLYRRRKRAFGTFDEKKAGMLADVQDRAIEDLVGGLRLEIVEKHLVNNKRYLAGLGWSSLTISKNGQILTWEDDGPRSVSGMAPRR